MVALTADTQVNDENLANNVADEQQKMSQFEECFNEGKRAFALNDYQLAADNLSNAAQLSVEIFGELDKAVFEPHFYYGKVLLELERAQKGNVLTEAVGKEEGEHDDDDSSEGESDQETADPSAAEVVAEVISESNEHSETMKETADDAVKDEKDDPALDAIESGNACSETVVLGMAVSNEENRSDGAATKETSEANLDHGKKEDLEETIADVAEGGKEAAEDDEEAGPLQLAWEVLEVARAVCDRNLNEDGWKEKKVEVLLVLAQCSLEDENYGQAIEDLTSCIELASSIFDADDRRLAEANYQTGQACCLGGQFWVAAEYFAKAKDILEARCCNLEKKIEKGEGGEIDFAKELEELKVLIPEIQLKIDDCKGSAEAENLKKIATEKLAQTLIEKNANSEALSASKPVDDISALVRKKVQKRNMEEEDYDTAKRSKND